MKKVMVLLISILLLTGCYNDIGSDDTNTILNTFLGKNTKLVNTYSEGYKYYLPNEIKVDAKKDYNEVLDYNGYKYYLYVDVVGYYYKKEVDFVKNDNIYYSKYLDYNNKKGYINIEKVNDLYKVEMYYNYAKIEAYVDYDNLSETIINMCYITNSLVFNNSVTNLELNNSDDKLKEEKFDFYTPKKEGNFIDYINKYDDYKVKSDENNIGNEGN